MAGDQPDLIRHVGSDEAGRLRLALTALEDAPVLVLERPSVALPQFQDDAARAYMSAIQRIKCDKGLVRAVRRISAPIFAAHVIKNWENVNQRKNGNKVPVEFSRSMAFLYLRGIPDWLFDQIIMFYFGKAAAFDSVLRHMGGPGQGMAH